MKTARIKKEDTKTKIRILKPILDDWNRVQTDCWEVAPTLCKNIVEIRRAYPADARGIHGILVTDIANICNAYEWTFSVHYDEVMGLRFQL